MPCLSATKDNPNCFGGHSERKPVSRLLSRGLAERPPSNSKLKIDRALELLSAERERASTPKFGFLVGNSTVGDEGVTWTRSKCPRFGDWCGGPSVLVSLNHRRADAEKRHK